MSGKDLKSKYEHMSNVEEDSDINLRNARNVSTDFSPAHYQLQNLFEEDKTPGLGVGTNSEMASVEIFSKVIHKNFLDVKQGDTIVVETMRNIE